MERERLDTWPFPHVKQIAGGDLLYDKGAQLALCHKLERWDRVGSRRETPEAGSDCCMAEINTTL